MKQLKKISLSKVSGFLSDSEMKKVIGGGYGLNCNDVERCECDDHSAAWYQCAGASVGPWACTDIGKGGGYCCEPAD